MLIICPKCFAKYQIPENINLPEGRKLKCSACNHLFEKKAEEQPFILEKPTVPENITPLVNQATLAKNNDSITDVFQMPLYTKPLSEDDWAHPTDGKSPLPTDSLPEAFIPVEPTKPKKNKWLWVLLLYFLVIVALCMTGWHFKSILTPSFQGILPPPVSKTDKIVKNFNVNPITIQTPQEPSVPAKDNPPATPASDSATEPPTGTEPMPNPPLPALQEQEIPLPTAPEQAIALPQPILSEQSEIIPAVPEIPIPPVSDIPPVVEDSEPLFQVVSKPQAVIPTDDLIIKDIQHRIEPDETGIPQLLVEGQIISSSDKPQLIPALNLIVWNSAGEIVKQKKVYLSEENLDPNQAFPFYTSIVPAPDDTARVDIEIKARH